MAYTLSVENIKCGGCANTIRNKLEAIDGVERADVDVANGQVTVEAADATRDEVLATLLRLGYPETGTTEGLSAARARAKSFVSCAVGKIGS